MMNKLLFRIHIIILITVVMITSIISFPYNTSYNYTIEPKESKELTQNNAVIEFNNNFFFPNNVYGETTFIKEAYSTSASSEAISNTNDDPNQTQSNLTVKIPFGAGKPDNLFEYYIPSSIHIKKGDSITWVNNDAVSHTVTAARLNSGLILPQESTYGKSNFSHAFDHPGIFSYFCQIHPYMSGTVYVDVTETQRELVSTIGDKINVIVEMPMDTAYENYYNHYFIPANAFVPVGGTITWINNDYVPHTATAADNSFDTKTIDPFGSKSMVFTNEGRIAYYCKIHPWMQASITVTPN